MKIKMIYPKGQIHFLTVVLTSMLLANFSYAQVTTSSYSSLPVAPVAASTTVVPTTTTTASKPIKDSATGSSTMQKVGMVAGGAAAGFSASQAYASCTEEPVAMTPCVLWTLGAAAGLGVAYMMATAADKSDKTKDAVTDKAATGTTSSTPNTDALDNSQAASRVQDYVAGIKKDFPNTAVSKNGVATLPDGRKVNALDPASIASQLTPSEQQQFKQMMDQAAAVGQAAAKSATDGKDILGADSDGGGGGKFKTTVIDDGVGSGRGKAITGLGAPRAMANVAGLKRNVGNGEQIGGAGDDLFGMITNRYNYENNNQSFIGSPAKKTVACDPGAVGCNN